MVHISTLWGPVCFIQSGSGSPEKVTIAYQILAIVSPMCKAFLVNVTFAENFMIKTVLIANFLKPLIL